MSRPKDKLTEPLVWIADKNGVSHIVRRYVRYYQRHSSECWETVCGHRVHLLPYSGFVDGFFPENQCVHCRRKLGI